MEKRVQLLLDARRHELVVAEAKGTGRSQSAVIREAIDVRFEDEAPESRALVNEAEAREERADALGEFLEMMQKAGGPEEDVVAELHREFEDHLNRKGG